MPSFFREGSIDFAAARFFAACSAVVPRFEETFSSVFLGAALVFALSQARNVPFSSIPATGFFFFKGVFNAEDVFAVFKDELEAVLDAALAGAFAAEAFAAVFPAEDNTAFVDFDSPPIILL